jgi:hypothetical protein
MSEDDSHLADYCVPARPTAEWQPCATYYSVRVTPGIGLQLEITSTDELGRPDSVERVQLPWREAVDQLARWLLDTEETP